MKRRIISILLLSWILLVTPLLTLTASAKALDVMDLSDRWNHWMDLLWEDDAQLVKKELKELQKYMLPLDRPDKFHYQALNVRGGGNNQKKPDGYRNRMNYNVQTTMSYDGITYPLTNTLLILKLPDMPVLDHGEYEGATIFYHITTVSNRSWDDIVLGDGVSPGSVTSIGGFPAKGGYSTTPNNGNARMTVMVKLTDLFPDFWDEDDQIFEIRITATGCKEGTAAWAKFQELCNIVLKWQPEMSEPVVFTAYLDNFEIVGLKPGNTNIITEIFAGGTEGEDEGTSIPAAVILGVLGAGAAAAGAAVAGSGASDGKDKKNASSYKMYINKNFDDQLKKGEAPQAVFARIAEVRPDGSEVDRPDMTRQIRVFSSDNSLNVEDGGMKNNYRCAMVRVYDEAEPPPEGRVSFFFEGAGGTYTQNVIFRITVPGINFFQENLTLPAGALDEPEFLPFEITGLGEKYEVEVEYSGDEYEVDLTDAADKEAKNVRFAVFMEKDKQPIEAGVYTEHWLNVTARNDKQELKASLKIIRMGLGLNVSAKAINCYRVPKQESVGKAMKDMKPADFDTSITETQGYLITYDAENHTVIQQPAFPTVTFAPLENEEPEKKKQIAEALQRLDIQFKVKDYEEDVSNCVFYCKGGFLDAPTRYYVKMTLSYTVGETTYTKEKEVLLRSQACRLVTGVRENYEVDKYDDQITEALNSIKAIVFDYYYNQLFPLYNMIDRMTYGYDRAYGYDPYQVAKVFDVWNRFQTGEMLGANAEAYKYGIADELEALAAATRSWDGFQGIVLRLSLDIMTGGASEVVMVALDVNRAAMDYRKETGGNGTAYGYFKAMALPIAFAVVPGGVAKYGKKITGTVGKVANYIAPNKTAALMKKVNTVKGVAKEMTELMVKDAKEITGYVVSKIPQGAKNVSGKVGKAINEFVEKVDKYDPRISLSRADRANAAVRAGVNKGRAKAEAALAEARKAPKTAQDLCMDSIENASAKEGQILYNDLIAAKKATLANPTSKEALQEYNQALIKFQSSHDAIEHINNILPGEELTMRATINADLQKTLKDPLLENMSIGFGDKYNIDPKRVRYDCATGNANDALKLGRDFDFTPKFVTEEGKVKLFSQATTDEIRDAALYKTIKEKCGEDFANEMLKNGSLASQLDITGCTIQHMDYFEGGIDVVEKITKKERMAEYVAKGKGRSVADTLRFKGQHAYTEGLKIQKEVMSRLSDSEISAMTKKFEAIAKADAETAKKMLANLTPTEKRIQEAVKWQREGVYQNGKYGKKMLDKQYMSISSGYDPLLDEYDYAVQCIYETGAGNGAANTKLSEMQYALGKQGTNIGNSIGHNADMFDKINNQLGYGSTSKTIGAVGVGGFVGGTLNNQNGQSANP